MSELRPLPCWVGLPGSVLETGTAGRRRCCWWLAQASSLLARCSGRRCLAGLCSGGKRTFRTSLWGARGDNLDLPIILEANCYAVTSSKRYTFGNFLDFLTSWNLLCNPVLIGRQLPSRGDKCLKGECPPMEVSNALSSVLSHSFTTQRNRYSAGKNFSGNAYQIYQVFWDKTLIYLKAKHKPASAIKTLVWTDDQLEC